MANLYRIFGAELSPYSVKVRSYCRYKGIPHQWIIRSAAGRIARMMTPMADEHQYAQMRAQVRERMVKRVWFVGSSEQTAPQIEESFCEGIAQLEVHLSDRPYLFGARPAFGDLGLWG